MLGLNREVIQLTLVGDGGCLRLEAIEELIELRAVEHEACALLHRRKVRAPLGIEGAALHADVLDRLGVGEAALQCSLLPIGRRLGEPRTARTGLLTWMCVLGFARFSW